MEKNEFDIQRTKGNADVLIVDNALAAVAKQNTVVVVGDTDILVFLIYHTKKGLKRHYMQPENTLNNNIQIHIILPCLPLLRYNLKSLWHWKTEPIKKLKSCNFVDQAKVFLNKKSTSPNYFSRRKAMALIYNCNVNESIDPF